MTSRRAQLLASAQALCNAFASKAPLETLLSHFSTTHQVIAFEHGEPLLAPFLGRPFTGLHGPDSVSTYFSLLQKYITYDNMTFGNWAVDTEARKVCVQGSAEFTWTEGKGNGQSWDEEFVYVLDFDHEGKLTDYNVWADSGAAYLARCGELEEKRKDFQKAHA